jgi:DNA-binding winged helix-turn-helix (wHTH) protein
MMPATPSANLGPVVYRFLDFELDAERYELRRGGEAVAVEAKSLDLLLHLVCHHERVVTREELFRDVWPGLRVTSSALSQALYGARKAVDDDARRQRVVRTVRGRGFRFVAEVSEGRSRRMRAGPGGLGPGGSPPFVGRREILGELEDALDEASAGRGRLVLIGGEPGIGKSRLAEEFAEQARKRGVLTHLGRCREDEGAPAYWPWLQLLRAHATHVGAERWRELLHAWPEIAQMAPELDPEGRAGAQSELEAGPARFRLFDGLSRLWQDAAAGEAPLLLVFDDLHRADTPSWLLLRFLARDIAAARILLVGTYRDTELRRNPARTASFAELAREAHGQLMSLEGFSREEVADFVALMTGRDLDAVTLEELHQRTAGNPFFLFHLAPLLVQATGGTGAAERSRGAGHSGSRAAAEALKLPLTLREAIARQLDGLPEEARGLLRLASVAGREFALALLSEARGESADPVLVELAPALAAGAVVEHAERVGHYRFAHLLVRDALYASLTLAERAALHLRIGEALERGAAGDPQAQLADLAHHFHAAVPVGGLSRAIDYASQAGYAAAGRLAFEEAAPLFRQALQLADRDPTTPERTCDLLIALGEAETRTGERDRARTTFTRAAHLAKRIGAAEKLAETALNVAPGFFSIEAGVVDPFTISLLEEAIESLSKTKVPSRLRVQLVARLSMALYWSHETDQRRVALVEEARAMADRISDPRASIHASIAEVVALWAPDNLERRLELADSIVADTEGNGLFELSLIGRIFRIACCFEMGDISRLEREIITFAKLVDLRGLRQAQWYPALHRAALALHKGQLETAERDAQDLSRLGARSQDSNVIHSYAAITAMIRWYEGRAAEVLPGLISLADRFPGVTGWRSALALLSINSGFTSQGIAEYERVLGRGIDHIRRDQLWIVTITQLGEACAEINDQARAPLLYEALLPYSGRFAIAGYGVLAWAPVDRALGQLAGVMQLWDESERFFKAAGQLELAAGARGSWAYTLYQRAQTLLKRRQSQAQQKATRYAEESLAVARELGLKKLANSLPQIIERART